MPVYFHSEDLSYHLQDQNLIKNWISSIIKNHQKTTGDISVIFCSNDYLLRINKEYLNHSYYTDVITFSYNEETTVSGDIFVSVEQVKINSVDFKVSFEKELFRVIIHGVLHLIGFNDKSDLESKEIRNKENESLTLLQSMMNGKSI